MKQDKKVKSDTGMKRGITRRLYLYFILVVLGISGLILLSNTLLLRPLYYYSLRETMIRAADSISSLDFTADSDTWTEQLNAMTAGAPYDVVVRSGEDILYSSNSQFGLHSRPELAGTKQGESYAHGSAGAGQQGSGAPEPGGRFFYFNRLDTLDRVGDGMYIGTLPDKQGAGMMVAAKEYDDGTQILLTQPVEPINQSIRQANILLVGCALLAAGISAIFVFRISKRFTKPIMQIQNTVGAITALDFSKTCDIRTGDELQSLGEDVNRLSDKLKSALGALKMQNEQLESDIAAQRQFISNASHELRTPLALIKGYADEINAGFIKGAAQTEQYIGVITEEAAKMNRLLKEMLELTRMESGMARLENARLCVNESVRTFLEKYDGFISENGLNVELCLADDADGYFDAMRFEQVLANYISNAARYGDEQKRVVIKTEILEDTIRVSVFNTGKGISNQVMEHIWDGFFKANSARTRYEDSYGLGLSIVKAIQSAAGQAYGAENMPDGVVFWFDVRRFTEE
jgi:two-component system sensor histidine kinase VanS